MCITDYYTIGQQKDVCTITAWFLFLRILTTNYIHTIGKNTKEDATEITIPWFNTNLIYLQCICKNDPACSEQSILCMLIL